jgi:hypothetical protein
LFSGLDGVTHAIPRAILPVFSKNPVLFRGRFLNNPAVCSVNGQPPGNTKENAAEAAQRPS